MIDENYKGQKGIVVLRDDKYTKNGLKITNIEDIEVTLIEQNSTKNEAYYFIEKGSDEYKFFEIFFNECAKYCKFPFLISDYNKIGESTQIYWQQHSKGIVMRFVNPNTSNETYENNYKSVRQARSGSRNHNLTLSFNRLCESIERVRDEHIISYYEKL